MTDHDFTRILIESTVNRTLAQMEKDPRRSLRNLVDLGLTFSNGRFQKTFLELAQSMLEHDDSAYYQLLDLLIHKVNHDTLKTFGINMGYEGLTKGASILRENQAAGGYSIPWLLSLTVGTGALDSAAAGEIVRQGMAEGIYIYALSGKAIDFSALQELLALYPRCAFLVATSGTSLLHQDLSELAGCHNLMIAVDADEDGLEAVEALSNAGFLYGIHVHYQNSDCIKPEMLERYLDYHPAAVFLFPADTNDIAASEEIFHAVKALRMEQKYPYFLLDVVQDGLFVDQIISKERFLLHILGDGTALGIEPGGIRRGGNALHVPLRQLLQQLSPKTTAADSGR